MLLAAFSGGLSINTAPHLIPPTAATVCNNVDLSNGILEPFKSPVKYIDATDSKVVWYKNKYSFHPQNSIFCNMLDQAFVATPEKTIQKTLDGEIWYNIAIESPTQQLTIEPGPPNPQAEKPDTPVDIWGTFYGPDIRYCYTYYNANDGTESAPSPFTAPVKVGEYVNGGEDQETSNDYILYSYATIKDIIASDDPQVTHIRIYRMGGGITTFSLVMQIPNISSQVLDNTPSANLGNGITTIGYQVPPKVNYIATAYGMLFGCNENILYFSDENVPTNWNPLNYIVFDDNIVGIGCIQSGILVFTRYRTYIIAGNSATTFYKQLLLDNIGCLSAGSILTNGSECIWQSDDGLYMYSNVGLQNLSFSRVGNTLAPIKSCCLHNRTYYGLMEDKIVCINFHLQGAIYYLDYTAGTSIINAEAKVLVCNSKEVTEFAGAPMTMRYKTGWVASGGLSRLKTYKTFYVYAIGDISLKVYMSGELVADTNLANAVNEVKIMQGNTQGYYIEFEVTGTGELYEIEYVQEYRQNGR